MNSLPHVTEINWKGAASNDTPSGAEILSAVSQLVRKYVVLTAEQADAIALHTAHTHAFGAADCTPYLNVTSVEKQSGKTRLLEVLEWLVARPWLTGRVTAAVLARKIDSDRPTLLLDESDAAFKYESDYSEALRGILNTGYRRSGATSLCVGKGADLSAKDFSTFCPKVIAGIGRLPDTVADRSIRIELRRRKADEPVARLRRREYDLEATPLRSLLHTWATGHVNLLREARPAMPETLRDRAADTWEPLIAIADEIGADWPTRARHAAETLSGQTAQDDESIAVQLLSDTRVAFAVAGDPDALKTAELIEKLVAMDDRPWGEWSRGKPLSSAKLATMLKGFAVVPGGSMRFGHDTAKGYRRASFEDAWSRYLPSEPSHRNAPNETAPRVAFSSRHTDGECDASQSVTNPIDTERSYAVTPERPRMSHAANDNGDAPPFGISPNAWKQLQKGAA